MNRMFESFQARILVSASIIALLFTLLVHGISAGIGDSIIFIIVFGLSSLISIFDVNCTIMGGCTIFSWLKTIFLLLSFISIIFVYSKLSKLEKTVTPPVKEAPVVKPPSENRTYEPKKSTLEQFYNLLK
jgi:hypothetical protein